MILSKGSIFRCGQRIKDFGERMGHVRVFGFHVFGALCRPVIAAGLAIKNSVLTCPISELK